MNADDPRLCGAAEIADGRWILWSMELTRPCILTLSEKWFSKDLKNASVRITFDEGYVDHPPSIFIDSTVSETSNVAICIAHFGGLIEKLVLRISDTSSILAPLIVLIDDDSSIGPLQISTIMSSNSSSAKMTRARCGILKNRLVTCIYWSSSQDVYFGLRGGDTLHAGLQDEDRGQNLSLVEHLFRDTAFLQVLWHGIMQTDNYERATLGLCSVEIGRKANQNLATRAVRDHIVMAVSSEGELRVWSTKSKKCVLQIAIGQLLSDWLVFETFEDAKITACLNPQGDLLQISLGINVRNRVGGDKEWHIAMLEINLTDITASAAGSEGRLRVTSLLSPPSCPCTPTQDMPRNLYPTLLDLQLYPSHSSSVVMSAWRWSWIGTVEQYGGEMGTITQNALASHILSPNPSVSVMRGSMSVVDDGFIASRRQVQHTKEDLAVCGLLTGSSVQSQDLQTSLKNIKCAMIQRVFLPDRISLRVIASVLGTSVPIACRYDVGLHDRATRTRDSAKILGACVQGVLESCSRWADMIYTDMGGVPTPSQELEAQAKAFLLFIDLCEKRTQSIEGFTVGCLQRAVHRASPPSSSSSSTSSALSQSVAVGVSRRSLELTFVLIPTKDKVDTPNSPACTPTCYQMAGSAALQLVESAIELNHDQAVQSDMRLQLTFQSNAVLDFTNLTWLSESIKDLAAAVQSVTPSVVQLMQSSTPPEGFSRVENVRAWITTHFGDIEGSFRGSLCCHDEPSLTLEKSRATSQQNSTPQPSSDFLRTVSGMAGSEIRENYCKARSKAVLLTLLSSSGGSLHSSLSSFIVTDVLPHALFSMVYWSLLLWLNTVRCTDSTACLESADFFDLFVSTPQDDQTALRTLHIPSSSDRASVWDAFCAYSMSNTVMVQGTLADEGSMRHACAQLLKESRPSPTNALLSYLTRATQHSAVSRVSSVLLWGELFAGKGVIESSTCGSAMQSLADVIVRGRLQSSVAVASFLECFRQMLRGRINTDSEESSEASSERTSKDILLTQMLDNCLEDLIIAVWSPPSQSMLDMMDSEAIMDTAESDDFHAQLMEGLNRHSEVSPGYLNSSLLCLRDRLAVLHKSSNALAALVAGSRTDSRHAQALVASFSCRSPELFLHLHRIAHLTDVVEITKRIRDVTLRPKDSTGICSGAALAIRANYALADAVDEALHSLTDPSDPQQSEELAVRLHLSVEQAVCWSRVFEHAVEQQSFDEALGAVLRLVELAHSYDASFALKVEDLLKSSGVSGWRVALGSMVLHACTTGRLGWLCSLNDIWVRGLHISGAISEEIERLASSGYSTSDGIASPSYYECSCVYALSRQNLQEAARMSVMQVQAVDRQQTGHMLGDLQSGMVAGTTQIRALSVAVTALSVIEPQHAAFVLLRTRTPSSSNERLYDTSMGEDEEKGPDLSDDPLSMRSVQQLSAYLQLRIAASMLTSTHADGSKEATALHLAITLEELEASEKPLVDSSSGYSVSSNVLARCAGQRHPKGYPSSSSGRARVIFSMASSAAARHVQMSAHSGSSSADHRLQSEYSPQGGCGMKGLTSTLHQWTPLLDTLALFDTPGLNWALHQAAFEGVLSERILEVPPALVESYRNAGGDMAALLRLLLAHGHLLEASYLATSLLELHGSSKTSTNNKQSQIVPYNVIDEVIIAARQFISLISAAVTTTEDLRVAKGRERNALQSQVFKLEKAIKQHFILILAAEID